MMLQGCPREKELKQALDGGYWPQACPEELRAHVAGCRACSERVLLTEGFRQARAASMSAARTGSPGLLWWRAQLRRRNEAVERIGRPLLGAQIFALCVTLAAVVGFAAYVARQQGGWLEWIKGIGQSASAAMGALWPAGTAGSGWLLPVIALSALAVLGGVVVFFSFDRS
jgi:hypothetical protein